MQRFCFILVSAAAPALLLAGTGTPAAPGGPLVSVVRVGPNGKLVRVNERVPAAPIAKKARVAAIVAPVLAPVANSVPDSESIARIVEEAAKRYDIDPLLINSVIRVESNFNPMAVSPKGAQGLMQLIPATAQRFGVADPFDVKQNIEGGARYLRHLQDLFPNDLSLSIAAYNAGEGAVSRFKSVPPFPETVDYVKKVSGHYAKAQETPAPLTAPVAAVAQPDQPTERHVELVSDAEGRLYLRTR